MHNRVGSSRERFATLEEVRPCHNTADLTNVPPPTAAACRPEVLTDCSSGASSDFVDRAPALPWVVPPRIETGNAAAAGGLPRDSVAHDQAFQ
eukprot:3012799-Karenia_brevis.AAC.1